MSRLRWRLSCKWKRFKLAFAPVFHLFGRHRGEVMCVYCGVLADSMRAERARLETLCAADIPEHDDSCGMCHRARFLDALSPCTAKTASEYDRRKNVIALSMLWRQREFEFWCMRGMPRQSEYKPPTVRAN